MAPRQLVHGDRPAPVGGGASQAPCCGGASARRAGGERGEGAEHLPGPEGQAQRTAAKCYRGWAFSSALSKMEGSWQLTAPTPARGVR